MFDELKEVAEDRRTKALNGGIEIGMHIRDEHEKVAKEMVDELLEDPERFLLQTLLHTYFFDSEHDSKAGLIELMYRIVNDMRDQELPNFTFDKDKNK